VENTRCGGKHGVWWKIRGVRGKHGVWCKTWGLSGKHGGIIKMRSRNFVSFNCNENQFKMLA